MLDRLSQNWIKKKVHFISRNTLYEEFKWADIMVYISSSASIESLLCSLPVIRLDIDKFDISKSIRPANKAGDLLITHPKLIHTEKNYSTSETRISLEFRLTK